jgi:uncharacterized protein HemY
MHLDLQQSMRKFADAQAVDLREASRFTPVDFRLGVQWLVTQNNMELAQALAEAGLALYPKSEDILAIGGLLAMTREDWHLAIELLNDLIILQGDRTQPMTCQMLARALACNLDIAEAHQVLDQAMKLWPNNPELEQEKSAMTLSQDVMSAPSQFN